MNKDRNRNRKKGNNSIQRNVWFKIRFFLLLAIVVVSWFFTSKMVTSNDTHDKSCSWLKKRKKNNYFYNKPLISSTKTPYPHGLILW